MLARQIMTSPVVTVTPETPVKRAAGLLTEHGFTALPVVDARQRLVGIVTEADLVRDRVPGDARFRGSPAPQPPSTVGAVMSTPAVSMDSRADLSKLVAALLDEGFRAMPIVDGERLVGIVTRRDVVRALSRDDTAIARDVRRRLMIYGGPDRWSVKVDDGVVTIVDEYDDPTDRHVATLLAESVPGVVRADTRYREGAE
ncbi:CBS-domain-containing membrane protein [Saccharomonospora marina XMU15]|uniref:CBS-domain-containing membrane protein n=1 Tax=Saccharomonospora marina XMU15 TaxID=882083 RepID=H5X2P1_9PSEU|nr:CBS domain-containing protein [Saccharomonospora marina]EHR50980.1 CBS-domain-containing membrane protein [Saccharomonospora marina XMU15]